MKQENKMAVTPMKHLFWKMGLPMILSMVLQALYNVIDSIFITNMKDVGTLANQALTLAFPIQILMIAIGVGTGVGLNTLLSKSLGENEQEEVNKIAGNGIFLSLCVFLCFFLFGLVGVRSFITFFAGSQIELVDMGVQYLQICCIFSLGGIGYTVYERLLQATGKTTLSMVAQISGAVCNIVLDYLFIFPLQMGVAGAAYATVIGQFLSLFMAMYFHYCKNKEISGALHYLKPNITIIKQIYHIGLAATLMQALLSIMMAGMNYICLHALVDANLLVGSFGIYYKIQQIALFSAFGLSNTIISILSFNYGMKDKKRIDECIRYGLLDTFIVTLIIAIVFEITAPKLAQLFSLTTSSSQITLICIKALRIASIGYIFMGITVAIQGILQSLRYALRPLVLSFLRLVVFVFPIAYYFSLQSNSTTLIWFTFPIAEILTAIISVLLLKKSYDEKIKPINATELSNHFIIAVSREHGTNGKEIARQVAQKLNLAFYDKERIKDFAIKEGFVTNRNVETLYQDFLSLDVNTESMIKQKEVIQAIARKEDCVIVGRAADYFLQNEPHLIKIFLYAPQDYRINKIMELYHDDYVTAKKYMEQSDKKRSQYYEMISNQLWGDKNHHDICLNTQLGNEEIINIIYNYICKVK